MRAYVTIKAAFVALLALNALLWSQGSYTRRHRGPALSGLYITKRSLPGLLASGQYSDYVEGTGKVCSQSH